jgi:hypothetical protein
MSLDDQTSSSGGSRQGVTRRGLLISMGGLAAALGVGAASLTDEGFLRDTLHRLVGRFEMAPDQFAAFAQDFRAAYYELDTIKALPFRASERLGAAPVVERLAPHAVLSKLEAFERRLLTDFTMATDYLSLQADDPTRDATPVSYFGLQGCSNPFANLAPP